MKLALSCAVVLAASVAAPALAGPAGTGLGHTEALAHRVAAERTLQVASLGDCAARAAGAARAQDGVARVSQRGDAVTVVFKSTSQAARQQANVRAAISSACSAS